MPAGSTLYLNKLSFEFTIRALGSVMAVTVDSSLCALADAPDDIAALQTHWQELRGTRIAPARSDIDPAKLRAYLGYLCILEVCHEPADFIFSLFGSGIADFLHRDLSRRSVRDFQPAKLGQYIFEQLCNTVESRVPTVYRVEVAYDNPSRTSASYRLNLPLSDDGENINRILTYTRFDAIPPDFWGRIIL